MLCLPLSLRMSQEDQSVFGFMVPSKVTLPRTAACLPRADAKAITEIWSVHFPHKMTEEQNGLEYKHGSGVSCTDLFFYLGFTRRYSLHAQVKLSLDRNYSFLFFLDKA